MKQFTDDYRYPVGAKFHIEGDSKDMWISIYNVRVITTAKIVLQPRKTDKKIVVSLDDIDGDRNVCVRISKSALKNHNRINN